MSHYTYLPEAFDPGGVLKKSPSSDIVSTLGKYGMVHPLASQGGKRENLGGKDLGLEVRVEEARKAKFARVWEGLESFVASDLGEYFIDTYEIICQEVSRITELVGEKPPALEDSEFLKQGPSLMESYDVFQKLGLLPKLVLAPTHRSVDWWYNLGYALEESPLNPHVPDPYNPRRIRNVIQDGGLAINGDVHDEWNILTGAGSKEPSWSLSVMAMWDEAYIFDTTSFGYVDPENTIPDNELNQLLAQLGWPIVEPRGENDPITQPNIHPDIETYIMSNFIHLLNYNTQTTLNEGVCSWLDKGLELGPDVPLGRCSSIDGGVYISHIEYGYTNSNVCILPTMRGTAL